MRLTLTTDDGVLLETWDHVEQYQPPMGLSTLAAEIRAEVDKAITAMGLTRMGARLETRLPRKPRGRR